MAMKDKYSVEDLKKDFPTDDSCLAFLFEENHSYRCSCGGTYRKMSRRKKYQCSLCRYQISPAAGTIFHKSDTPLTLWFHALFIFSNAKSGISAKEMERQLGVTYKCAWRMLSQIRKALGQPKKPLKGIVETDTAYVGGHLYAGENNEGMGRSVRHKSVLMAAIERHGGMRAKVTPSGKLYQVKKFLRKSVRKGSMLATDSFSGYKGLGKNYMVLSVNHSKKEYSRNGVHINRTEAWFGHIKRSIRGTYKNVSKQHLQSYVDSFVWHYNNRGNDRQRFSSLLGALTRA